MSYNATHVNELNTDLPYTTESPSILDDATRELKRCIKNDWAEPTSDKFVTINTSETVTLPDTYPNIVRLISPDFYIGDVRNIVTSYPTDEPYVVDFFNVGGIHFDFKSGGNIKLGSYVYSSHSGGYAHRCVRNAGVRMIKYGSYWYLSGTAAQQNMLDDDPSWEGLIMPQT